MPPRVNKITLTIERAEDENGVGVTRVEHDFSGPPLQVTDMLTMCHYGVASLQKSMEGAINNASTNPKVQMALALHVIKMMMDPPTPDSHTSRQDFKDLRDGTEPGRT